MKEKRKKNVVITFIKVIVIIPLSLFVLVMIYLIIGHYWDKWTEEEKQQFALECSQTESFYGLGISFTGFSIDEIENVLIKRMHKGQMIDSFYISPYRDNHDRNRSRYWASIDTMIYIKDTYHIIVPQSQTFILTDLKMGMSPRFTMFSENYGCEVQEYCIDGIKFEDSSHPDFIKEGFKYPWEESLPDSIMADRKE